MTALGIDTSNYTTSVALFSGKEGYNLGKLLEVPKGALGLRQSEALFGHVKRLPDMFHELRKQGKLEKIDAVGASTRPRDAEGSYMPCFLAGESAGRVLADTLNAPFFPCSHQQGHLAAAAWSAGREELLTSPFLAWHLSGGTTELLLAEPAGAAPHVVKLGGTSDISAGQLIDRAGKLLGLAFPAGRALDELAERSGKDDCFSVKTADLTFSLSGMENKTQELVQNGAPPEETARFVLCTLTNLLVRVTTEAIRRYPGLAVLCSGGVSSNRMLRRAMVDACGAVFAPPEYSADNAMGTAILAYRSAEGGRS